MPPGRPPLPGPTVPPAARPTRRGLVRSSLSGGSAAAGRPGERRESLDERPQLLPDLLVRERAILAEHALGARHEQAPPAPQLGAERAHDRQPRALGQDGAEPA